VSEDGTPPLLFLPSAVFVKFDSLMSFSFPVSRPIFAGSSSVPSRRLSVFSRAPPCSLPIAGRFGALSPRGFLFKTDSSNRRGDVFF